MNEKDMTARLLMAWMLGYPEDPELEEKSFIHQVLTKKMEVFKTGIKVPLPLSLILEVGLEGNPGLSQLVLAEVIKHTHIPSLPYTITAEDFAMTFPMSFPSVNDPHFMDTYQKKWDAQKKPDEDRGFMSSDNQVDTPEFWNNLIKSSMRKEGT